MSEDNPEQPGLTPDRTAPPSGPKRTGPGSSWAEALLEAEEEILRKIGTALPLPEVLVALCEMVESLCPGTICSVMLRDRGDRLLHLGAGPSLPRSFREWLPVLPVGQGYGTCAASVASGTTVIVPDIATDPVWSLLREGPLSLGLRASWSVPVVTPPGGPIGALGVFLGEAREPTPEERRVGDRAAQLAAICIGRHRADEATGRGQERLRLALEAGRMGTWEWDIRSGSVSWSDNLEEVHGLPPGTFDGTFEGFRALVHPEDRDHVEAAIADAIEGGTSYEVEFRVARPDGSVGWMLGKGLVFRGEDGTPDRMLGLAMDLTARKQAEEEVREQESQFRTLADSIPQLAWMARPDGWIFWYNRRWYDYTGTTPEQMEGWGWQSVHDPDELPRVVARFRAAIAAGEPWEDTFPLRRTDGAMRWHLSRAMPLRDEQGRVIRWFGTNTDITERKELEATLRESDRRKDEFLALLAHELRNPLAPITAALHLVGSPRATPEEASAALETAGRQFRHLARLIDDLMDVARINRGVIELRPEPVDLVELARRAIEACRPGIEERGHRLEVALPDLPIPMKADATRIEQVLWNLLHNASKYTEPGGRISLSVARSGGTGIVRVRDSGIGIDPGQLTRIFDPFTQAEVRRVRSRGGLGLGLSLVKNLIELHGGTVEARSGGPGTGSEFELRLPVGLEPSPIREVPAPAPRRPVALSPSRRVLIVDDNEDAAIILARLLRQSYGQTVAVAHDGPSALESARGFRPEVVLLDIGLPGIDGFEVARRLRRLPEANRARIVALTGWGQERDRRRSREAGFDHHLVKPAELDEILRLLRLDLPTEP